MSKQDDPGPPTTSSQGSHSGQWGLSAILLGSLLFVIFPLIVGLEFACLVGAFHSSEFVTAEHIQLGVVGAYALVGGVFTLAGISLLSAIVGLCYSRVCKQPAGLSVGGFVVGLSALLLAVLLLLVTNECAAWVRGWQKELDAGRKMPMRKL